MGPEFLNLFSSAVVMLQPLLGTFKQMRDMVIEYIITQDHHASSIAQTLMSIIGNTEEQANNNKLLKVDKFNAWLFNAFLSHEYDTKNS